MGLLWFGLRPPAPSANNTTRTGPDGDRSEDAGSNNGPLGDPTRIAQDRDSGSLGVRDNNSDSGAARLAQGQVLARATWGAGADQLGHTRPQEANPEAPMSYVVGPDGTLHVLDQANRRIQRFARDGRSLGSVSVGLMAPQDIALNPDGSYTLMDRLVDRTISVVGPDGRERARLPITGEGIERTGNVTGLFVDGTNVMVEREHGPLVRVGDTQGGDTSNREEVPGRPTRDGRAWITAGITEASEGRLYLNAVARPSREHMYTRELRVALESRAIVMLDSDRAGTVYLGVQGVPRGSTPSTPSSDGDAGANTANSPREQVLLLCFDGATGRPTGQATLPANTSPDETFREFTVQDEGGVIYALRDEQGVEYRHYNCNPN